MNCSNLRFPNHIKMLRKLTRTMPDKQLVNPDDLGPTSPANNTDVTAADSPSHEPRQAVRHTFDSAIAAAPPLRFLPLEYNLLCSLYYEWFQTPHPGALPVRLHLPPLSVCSPAVAGVHVNSRYGAGMTLDDESAWNIPTGFSTYAIRAAALALFVSSGYGGPRTFLLAMALPMAEAMPLRPGEPEPSSDEDEDEGAKTKSSSEDDEENEGAVGPPAAQATSGGRPGPQPWYFALHVPGQGYGVFSDWDLSAACGAVGGKQNFNKKFRSFEEAAHKASFRCPGARVPQFPHELDFWFSLIPTEPAMTKIGESAVRPRAPPTAPPAANQMRRVRPKVLESRGYDVPGETGRARQSNTAGASSQGTAGAHFFDIGDEVHIWWEDLDDADDAGAYYPAVIIAWGGGDGTISPPFYDVQHEGGGIEMISPDDPGRHMKARKKKITSSALRGTAATNGRATHPRPLTAELGRRAPPTGVTFDFTKERTIASLTRVGATALRANAAAKWPTPPWAIKRRRYQGSAQPSASERGLRAFTPPWYGR